jgi:hypothetical protein
MLFWLFRVLLATSPWFLFHNPFTEENDIVLIHEAMKMENEIRAPKSGVIKSLGVQEGDIILANHLLFEIEQRSAIINPDLVAGIRSIGS